MEKEINSLLVDYLKELKTLGKDYLYFDKKGDNRTYDRHAELKRLESLCLECKMCPLHKTRKNVVFGKGNEDAVIMLIGEAPGYSEDLAGEPFVGKAGQLLTRMLGAIDLTRDEVYIGNILKCRPPDNRDPLPEEVEACKDYLLKQIELIKPRMIIALGRHSLRLLTGYSGPLKQIRGNVLYYEDIKVIPTYHPAALIYHQDWKKGAWEDLKFVRKLYDECRT